MAAAAQWNRATQCRPQCYWRQYTEWEHRLLGLWSLVQAGEAFTDANKDRRVRLWVDMGAYTELRQAGHPAFGSPFFEPWEILGVCKEIAAYLNRDPFAQQQLARG